MNETGETLDPSHEPERPQGLVYEPAFVTEATERDSIRMLDVRGWVRPRSEAFMRVQSFGFHYHGMTHERSPSRCTRARSRSRCEPLQKHSRDDGPSTGTDPREDRRPFVRIRDTD